MRSFNGARAVCHRCGRDGHLARDCSHHTCFRCNAKGHMAWECVEGVTCGRCGDKGHNQRNCKNVTCHRCGRRGHIAKFCNDPFAKAAEVERLEQQEASSLARAGLAVTWPRRRATVEMSVCSGSPGSSLARQREAASPWDDLGVRRESGNEVKGESTALPGRLESGLDRAAFPARGTAVRSRQVTWSLPERIAVLNTKRNGLALGPNSLVSKKPRGNAPVEEGVAVDKLSEIANESSLGSGGCVQTMHLGNISAWHGLVGYGSEDSGTEAELDMGDELQKPCEKSNCFNDVCTKHTTAVAESPDEE